MIANLPWNIANTRSGMPLLATVPSMLRRRTRPGSQPIQPPRAFGPKASEYPTTTQSTPDDGHRGEAVHHRAQHVLGADQPAVEHRQAGDHQQHQRRRGEHPGRRARIDGRLLGQWCRVGRLDPDQDRDPQDDSSNTTAGTMIWVRAAGWVPSIRVSSRHSCDPRRRHIAAQQGRCRRRHLATERTPADATESSGVCGVRDGYGSLRFGVDRTRVPPRV